MPVSMERRDEVILKDLENGSGQMPKPKLEIFYHHTGLHSQLLEYK